MPTAASTSMRAVPQSKPSPVRQMLAALEAPIEPVRIGFGYRSGLLLVAAMMLILPLVYLALVAAVGYVTYWHAVNDTIILNTRSARLALIAYLGPIVVGLILLGFMIKPLLARRKDDSVPLSLRREDEPVLFEFVHRLCRAVGAPPPSRIDVDLDANASASFRGGWTGMLRRDLVLTIGLPLAATLDARQFAGVLAHEFGHFTQGSAMRLTYVIRSMNAWFARIVYQRDSWDAALEAASEGNSHWAIQLIALLTRGMVWFTRRILWCLMWAGHGVSSMMLRQMEFDADRYECRVAGTSAFIQTSQRLACLNVASSVAYSELNDAWRERRLCDDLAALIRSREADMPPEIRTKLQKLGS